MLYQCVDEYSFSRSDMDINLYVITK